MYIDSEGTFRPERLLAVAERYMVIYYCCYLQNLLLLYLLNVHVCIVGGGIRIRVWIRKIKGTTKHLMANLNITLYL